METHLFKLKENFYKGKNMQNGVLTMNLKKLKST